MRGRGRDLDDRVYKLLNAGGTLATDRFFKSVTELGSLWAAVGASAALAREGRRREATDAMAAACTMWVVAQLLKRSFSRRRPYHALTQFRLLIAEVRGRSWPSSHPAVLLTFVTVASRDLYASQGVKTALAALAATVGLSRVCLGVHYPADVIGGLLLGRGVADLWSAVVSARVLKRLPGVAVPLPLEE